MKMKNYYWKARGVVGGVGGQDHAESQGEVDVIRQV